MPPARRWRERRRPLPRAGGRTRRRQPASPAAASTGAGRRRATARTSRGTTASQSAIRARQREVVVGLADALAPEVARRGRTPGDVEVERRRRTPAVRRDGAHQLEVLEEDVAVVAAHRRARASGAPPASRASRAPKAAVEQGARGVPAGVPGQRARSSSAAAPGRLVRAGRRRGRSGGAVVADVVVGDHHVLVRARAGRRSARPRTLPLQPATRRRRAARASRAQAARRACVGAKTAGGEPSTTITSAQLRRVAAQVGASAPRLRRRRSQRTGTQVGEHAERPRHLRPRARHMGRAARSPAAPRRRGQVPAERASSASSARRRRGCPRASSGSARREPAGQVVGGDVLVDGVGLDVLVVEVRSRPGRTRAGAAPCRSGGWARRGHLEGGEVADERRRASAGAGRSMEIRLTVASVVAGSRSR